MTRDPSGFQPVADGIDAFLSRSKEFDDLFRSVPLAESGRVMARAVERVSSMQVFQDVVDRI